MKQKNFGYSWIEIFILLSIMSIVIFAGISKFTLFLAKQEREILLSRLKNVIVFARNEALLRQKTLTLCGSHNQRSCHHDIDWSSGFILFENAKVAHQPAALNKIIQIFPALKYGTLNVTFSGAHPILHLHPTGMTMNMGAFVYSLLIEGNMRDTQVIINRGCRTYTMGE